MVGCVIWFVIWLVVVVVVVVVVGLCMLLSIDCAIDRDRLTGQGPDRIS